RHRRHRRRHRVAPRRDERRRRLARCTPRRRHRRLRPGFRVGLAQRTVTPRRRHRSVGSVPPPPCTDETPPPAFATAVPTATPWDERRATGDSCATRITAPQTEQRARTPPGGTFSGSTRNTD